jgi:hypothetical protein
VLTTGSPVVRTFLDSPPVALDGELSITDDENTPLYGATVQVTGGTFSDDGDLLSVNTAGTEILASYNGATETLSISGVDTLANYQNVLEQILFVSNSSNPTDFDNDPTRTISWTVNDGVNSSVPVTTAVSFVSDTPPPPTSPPVITAGSLVVLAAPTVPVTLDSALTVTDTESTSLNGATVQITGGAFSDDGDVLSVDAAGTGIAASYSSATETLSLSGTDTLANYQNVLEEVLFTAASSDPTNSGADPTRTISWTVNDGISSSAPVTTTVGFASNVSPPSPPPPPTPPSPIQPPGTSADMIMRDGSNGDYEIYDLGDNTILAAGYLGQVGLEWNIAGSGGFFGSDTTDMILRNDSGMFEVYDISNNNITDALAMGQVGLEWQVAGFGDFSSRAAETDMLMRNSNTGVFELYDISNNTITSAAPMGQVGLEWSVAGFGDFSGRVNETDMLMRNNNTGQFEVYDISDNAITSAASMGQVGLEWSVAGFGDFSGSVNETDLLMRNVNTGAFEAYDVSNNAITFASGMGQVGLEWQVAGFGDVSGNANETDMLMRNGNTGQFELYDISNNQITSAAAIGQVGLEWTVAGIANDPTSNGNRQLVQAVASIASPGSVQGAAIPVAQTVNSQSLMAVPQ